MAEETKKELARRLQEEINKQSKITVHSQELPVDNEGKVFHKGKRVEVVGNTKSGTVVFEMANGECVALSNCALDRGIYRRKRRAKHRDKKIVYPVKNLATTRIGNKREFWLYGDRRTAKKIYEIEFDGTLEMAVLENTGKGKNDWILVFNYWDDTQEVSIPDAYRSYPGFIDTFGNDDFILGSGGWVTGLADGKSPVLLWGDNGQSNYLNRGVYRGDGYISADVPLVWLNQYDWLGAGFEGLQTSYIEENKRTLVSPWTDGLKAAIAPSQDTVFYTHPSLIEGTGIIPEIPFDFQPTMTISHEEIREFLNPFSLEEDFRVTVVSGNWDSFNIQEYPALLYSTYDEAETPGYHVQLGNGSFDIGSLFDYLAEDYVTYREESVQGHPTNKVIANYSTGANPGLWAMYHVEPFIKIYAFKVSYDNDNPSYYVLEGHSITFEIEETDTAYYRIWQLTRSILYEIPFRLSFSSFYLNAQLKGAVERTAFVTKTTGEEIIELLGIDKNINYQEITYSYDGTSYYKRFGTIPYILRKGKTSFILCDFNFLEEKGFNASFSEAYQFYQGDQVIPITNNGDLNATKAHDRYKNSPYQVLNIIPWYDTLIEDTIYRIVDDGNLFNQMETTKKVEVASYIINAEGEIVTGKVTEYPVFPLGKNSDEYDNLTFWSASYYG